MKYSQKCSIYKKRFSLYIPTIISNMSRQFCIYKSKERTSAPSMGGRYTIVLGERLNGIQEVSGSIPLISTIM